MKKNLRNSIFAFIALVFAGTTANAQSNFDLETWSGSLESADNWTDLNSLTSAGFVPDTSVVKKPGQSGFAAELHPIDLTSLGYNFIGSLVQYGSNGSDGIAYTSLHDSVSFYYKYLPGASTAAQFGVALTAFNFSTSKPDTIASALFTATSSSSFTFVKIPFTYFSSATPDTLRALGAIACGSAADKTARFTIDQINLIGNHSTSTGIKNVNQSNSINVYPNVCDNVLHIEINGSLNYDTIKIFDLTGKEIKSLTCNDRINNLNTENLANGCYSYILTGKDSSTKSGKFIVNHQ